MEEIPESAPRDMEDDKCMITLTRDMILQNPDLLKSLFACFGSEKIINWILKREEPKNERAIPSDEPISA